MPILGNRLLKRQSVTYLLRDEFTTAASAPLTSPRTTEPGPGSLIITDTSNELSIASAKLTQSGAPATGFTDPRIVSSASFARANGRALLTKINNNSAIMVGWNTANTGDVASLRHAMFFGASTANAYSASGGTSVQVAAITSATDYQLALVLESTGANVFIKGGTEYPNWTLLFVFSTYTDTPLYPGIGYSGSGTRYVDYLRVADLTGAFATALGIATLNQSSPASGSNHTASADGLHQMTITAPNPLLGTTAIGTELRYRVQDANNYWTAYFREDGAFRVDSVSAGVATNRVSVAGAVTNGATRTICVVTSGSKHNFYTLSGSNWTKQGSEINVSHLDTQTTLQPQIGTNWSASNLRSWARTSAIYNQLNNA